MKEQFTTKQNIDWQCNTQNSFSAG